MTAEQIQDLIAEGIRTALAAQLSETAEEKAAREASEAAARAAPAAGQRSTEETAQVALLRSQADAFGVAALYDASASTGASLAELRSIVINGQRSKSNAAEIEGFTAGSNGERSGDEKLIRFHETTIGKSARAA